MTLNKENIITLSVSELMKESDVSFGTSGARGRVDKMTDKVCYAYTFAFLQYLHEKGELEQGCNVGVAGDLRGSTERIMNAVACAVIDLGCHPVNYGRIPSPAIAFLGLQRNIPTVMVTGSHIPDDRNGIKFNKVDGEILKDDEERICAQNIVFSSDLFSDNGVFSSSVNCLGVVDQGAANLYVQRYLDFFRPDVLDGMKVGLYEHSGVGRDLLYKILKSLGANVVRLNRSDVFIPVDTEAIREEDVRLAINWVREHDLDAIVSTDGDADRPLVGTEQGEWFRGDVAGILCSAYLGVDNVVTPVSSNSAVESCGLFKSVYRTRIGSPYVISGMQQAIANGGDVVAGYEANGGFLLATRIERGGKTLEILPTRDAVIVILSLLADARGQGKKLSSLADNLPARFTASDRVKEFPTKLSREFISKLIDAEESQAIEAEFGDLCGKVESIDLTDGLRIKFHNNEIIHLRPSGNAPEFRCYNEADTQERVEELNAECMKRIARWRS